NTALTGHLVLSTLHTSDAATTLPRLLDLGLEPYLITATVNVVIGQRLVRKICSHCKVKHTATPGEEKALMETGAGQAFLGKKDLWRGAGCDKCNRSGYRGRIGIYEVMPIDESIREAMLKRCSASQIRRAAISQGMSTMVEDGFRKAAEGITTLEEVLRVIQE
ncbi:MAG: ATPase, T2SS/T4P/T4SS family, partial [Patescibacteria group bacterium]